MLRSFRNFWIGLLVFLFLITNQVSAQEVIETSNPFHDPKIRSLTQTAVYGTVGGALLGTATLVFGGRPRTIAQGASLGLYAGLIFGSYVILSYMYIDKPSTQEMGGPDLSYQDLNQQAPTLAQSTQMKQTAFWLPFFHRTF